MKLAVSNFKRSDIEDLVLRPYEASSLPADWQDCFERLQNHGPVKTVKNEAGQVVTIVGIMRKDNPKEGEIWQVPAAGMAEKYSISYCRLLKELENEAYGLYDFEMLFTWCPYDDLHDRWMKFMGYHYRSRNQLGGEALYSKVVKNGRS